MLTECFHCLNKTLVWDSDENGDECGYEPYSIVQHLHCASCGAEVMYLIPKEEES